MTDASRYPAHVFWSDEDEGYIAIAPDLPGCSAFGDTQAEAMEQLQDAIEAWRDAASKAGNRIPEPSTPAMEYSGKFLLRMPKTLHAQLANRAALEGVSLNNYLNVLLAAENASHALRSKVSVAALSARFLSITQAQWDEVFERSKLPKFSTASGTTAVVHLDTRRKRA